ncbi:MAG: CD1247 N-terminal domain-containing protein [Dethiobacteria bacterium]
MHEIKTKVGYIRGLIDGLGLDESKKEGRVLVHIVDALEQIADELLDLDAGYDDLVDYLEAVDEDLMELEDNYYEEDDDFDDDPEDGFHFECPNCAKMIFVHDDVLDEDEDLEILCPNCGEVVLINEWDDDFDGFDEDDEEEISFDEEVIDDNDE